jgi:hypothetical protein
VSTEAGPGPASDVHTADPDARRKAVWILTAGALFCALAILGTDAIVERIRALAERDQAAAALELRRMLWIAGPAIVLPVLGFALWLWYFGAAIHRAGRFPPPGARTLRSVPVLEGAAARGYARLSQGLALVLVVCALVLADLVGRMLACAERFVPK